MQRTDRLFELIQILRCAGAPLSAARIAERMELSTRTIYRHIATLQAQRVPIDGAPGVGYVMRAGYDLPPIALDSDECEAVTLGLGLLARTGDVELTAAARRVIDKLSDSRAPLETAWMNVSDYGIPRVNAARIAQLRHAVRDRRSVRIRYRSLSGITTRRTIRPRCLAYYIEVAVVEAFCELRGAVRHFRIDRIEDCSAVSTVKTADHR